MKQRTIKKVNNENQYCDYTIVNTNNRKIIRKYRILIIKWHEMLTQIILKNAKNRKR